MTHKTPPPSEKISRRQGTGDAPPPAGVILGYRSRRRLQRGILSVLRVALVFLVVFVTSVPVIWILLTSLKRQFECLHSPPVWLPPLPQWSNFKVMWEAGGAAAITNSLIVTVGGTLIAVVGGIFVAYSLSRFRTGGQNLANWILSIKFLPPIVFAIPIANMFQNLKLLDTHLGLILIYGAFNMPFVIWMMKGFMDEVPVQLDESALIDGCSRLGVILRIVFPLSAPGLVSTTILTYVFIWSEYLFALVMGQHLLFTIPVRISQYYSDAVGWVCAPQAALASVAIVPIIIIALFGQRYIVRAMTYGAIKG